MIFIAIVIGCIVGALIGMYAPMVSYTYSGYLAIAIIAALDSVFGGIVATLKKNFNLTIYNGIFWKCSFSNTTYNIRTKIKRRYISCSNSSFCWKNVYKLSNNKKILHRYCCEKNRRKERKKQKN